MVEKLASKGKWPGVRLGGVDRFMWSKHSEVVTASVAALFSFAGMLVSTGLSNPKIVLQLIIAWKYLFVLVSAVHSVGGWWLVRTWKQLWRLGRGRWEQMAYDYGVRGFGVYIAVVIIILVTLLGRNSDANGAFGPLMMGGAAASIFFGVPIALHLGYFWGCAFAALVGVQRDKKLEIGDPPRIT